MTSGEALARNRRRKFWLTLGAIGLVGAPAGGLIGWYAGRYDAGIGQAVTMMSQPTAIVLVVGYILAMTIGTYVFAKVIDEVELVDNLWGSAVGFYAYAILFPCWWLLGTVGVLPVVNDWYLFCAVFLAAMGAYAWRKWRAR